MTKTQMREAQRLESAIASVVVSGDSATVESTSRPGTFYTVQIENLFSVSCNCEARTDDCIHRLAVDRFLDSERPSLYESIKADKAALANRVGEVSVEQAIEETIDSVVATIESEAAEGDKVYAEVAYAVLAATKKTSTATFGTCGHLSKNENDECPACRSKAWR